MWTVTRQALKGGLRIVEVVEGDINSVSSNILPTMYEGEGQSFDSLVVAEKVAQKICNEWYEHVKNDAGYMPQIQFKTTPTTDGYPTETLDETSEADEESATTIANDDEESAEEPVEETTKEEPVEEPVERAKPLKTQERRKTSKKR